MKLRLEENDLVLEGDLVHRVVWATDKSFDTLCCNVIDDYQPAYLLEVNREYPEYKLSEDVAKWIDPNEPITCLECLYLDSKNRVKDESYNAWVYDS